jgi:hypothetical protein
MVLSPFLIVLSGGGDGGGSGIGWGRRRGSRWRVRIGIRIGGDRIGEAPEDNHQTGDDDQDGPAMTPGEDVEGVQEKEDADENDPDRAAEGAEEAIAVGRSAVIGEAGASVSHLANEEPDTEADQEEGNKTMDGKAVKQPCVADEEQAA